MGADNYKSASSRLITLQNRKQQLEEAIINKNKELRELCFKEAQITNIMPPEVPLEPGETIPQFRRKINTAFEYPENLITKLNQEKETSSISNPTQSRITALETEIQFQRCILEDASRFVNDASNVKEKHKNKIICEQTKQKIKDLEEKIEVLKQQKYGSLPNNQLKQKKKPRPPFKFDIGIGTLKNNNNNNNYPAQNEQQQPLEQQQQQTKSYVQHNYHQYERDRLEHDNERYLLRNQQMVDYQQNYIPNYPQNSIQQRQEYRSSYTMERPIYYNPKDRHSVVSYHQNPYHQNVAYQNSYSNTLPPNVHLSPPTQIRYQSPIGVSQPNLNYPISPNHVRTSPLRTKSMDYDPRKSYSESIHNGYHPDPYYPTYNNERTYEQEILATSQNSPIYHTGEANLESTGLGGYWYKNDNNESIWVPTSSPISSHSHYPQKRFGSLDRRKEKYKQTPLPQPPTPTDNPLPPPKQIPTRNQQLVRTQSLGSVGASVDLWPDDNSSCESDGTSLKEQHGSQRSIRRPKPKGWCETSLDSHSPHSNNKELINPSLLEEPLYTPPSRISYTSPQSHSHSHTPQPMKVLEIPAESNPSPHQPEINVELLNNNGLIMDLPKNCTIVQAGQFKPYREVTKPFEMEDFYKYSTKFREKKKEEESMINNRNNDMLDSVSRKSYGRDDVDGGTGDKDRDRDNDGASVVQKSIYQPLQPMKCQPYGQPK